MSLNLIFISWFVVDFAITVSEKKEKQSDQKKDSSSIEKTNKMPEPVKETKSPERLELEKKIQEMDEKIKSLREESAQFHNPSTYAKYSKMQRTMITLQNKLEEEKKNLEQLIQREGEQEMKIEEKPQETVQEERIKPAESFFVQNKALIFMALKFVIPALVIFFLPASFLSVKMDSSYFSPLSDYFGEQDGPIYFIGSRLGWIMACFRTINRLKKVASGIRLSKESPAVKKEKIE